MLWEQVTMKNDDGRGELDDLIDRALRGYSGADPLNGLEDRIVRRVRVAGSVPRSPWLSWLRFAVPVAAALFLGAMVPRAWWKLTRAADDPQSHAAPRPAVIQALSRPEPALASRNLPAEATQAAKVRHHVRAAREGRARPEALPKEECFPSPAPMTREERVLVAWAMQAPADAREAFRSLEERTDQPVVIEPIRIQPLPGDGAK